MNSIRQGNRRNHRGITHSEKRSTRIDLTPMVDLGFLLITFFLFTTTLAKPRVMSMNMPYKPEDPAIETPWKEGQTLTLLLSKNHSIYYYEGIGNQPEKPPVVRVTGFQHDGIRQVVQDHLNHVKALMQQGVLNPGNDAAFLIKPDVNSTYNDFVQMMDELAINGVSMKAIADITPTDQRLIRQASFLH